MRAFDAQKAVYELLVAANVASGRIFNNVPPGTVYPFIEIGDPQTINDWAVGSEGSEINYTLHTWSTYDGSKECLDLYDLIRETLDGKSLAHDGQGTVFCFVEGGPIQLDPDGASYHGVVRIILNQRQ
jgi:hypothetical protein